MNIEQALRTQLAATFSSLNSVAAANAFPAPRTLSETLEKLAPRGNLTEIRINPDSASYFATAAVDMWLRSVHSFLVSASLTEASPIWASVSGYYSSHYAVRGLAHLLGYFQLFRRKKMVQLRLERGQYICSFKSKGGTGGEHQLYWKLVKQSAVFQGDGLFTENNPDLDTSDASIVIMQTTQTILQITRTFAPWTSELRGTESSIFQKSSSMLRPFHASANFPTSRMSRWSPITAS